MTLTDTTPPVPDVHARPGRPAHLTPGQLDRGLLARAVTFALTSVRAGEVEEVTRYDGLVTIPGVLPDGLFWRQADWIVERPCGTGCCIAGWIDIAGRGRDTALAAMHSSATDDESTAWNSRDVAVWLLLGVRYSELYLPDSLPGMTTRHAMRCAVADLFAADNDLDDVLVHADRLLDLAGQAPLTCDATGTFQ